MIQMLQSLEPRYEKRGTILFEELEEISEILFINKGMVDVGYEINKQKKYCIRHTDKVVIGAYNCTFNKRAVFIYKCKQACQGYFIRKEAWNELLDMDQYIGTTIKQNVKDEY